MTTWGFKDNLTVDNNKSLKWLDPNGLSNDLIGLSGYDFHINSASNGNIQINNNGDGYTFINKSNIYPTFIESKAGIGFSNTADAYADLTIVKNGWVGTNSLLNDGYLALSGSGQVDASGGGLIYIWGNENGVYRGSLELCAGNNTGGNVNVYTQNKSLKMQILNSGIANFQPDGSTVQFSVSDVITTVNNTFLITDTTTSASSTSGALQVVGGVGVGGDVYIDGSLNINSATGSINFDSTKVSTSYTSGAIVISGGIGINCTSNATSETSGGAISIAGGMAVNKDVYLGRNVVIKGTSASTTSQSGSLILYGGLGLAGDINTRSTSGSQITLTPFVNASPVGISFNYANNYTTAGSWFAGQSGGNFIINSTDYGDKITVDSTTVSLNGDLSVNNFSIPDIQGTYIGWNRDLGSGISSISNNRGLGVGGFEFLIYDTGANLVNTPMFINSNSIGINTTSPAYTLDINGSLYAQSITLGSLAVSSQSGYGSFEIGGPDGGYIDLKTPFSDDYDFRIITTTTGTNLIANSSSGTLSLGIDNNTNIFINTGGSVCVNTSTANTDSSLTVSGFTDLEKIRMSDLLITEAGVFTAGSGITSSSIATGLFFDTLTVRAFKTSLIIKGDALFTQMNIEGIQTITGWEYQENFIGNNPTLEFTMDSSGQLFYTSNTGNTLNTVVYDKTSYFI